MVVGGSGGEIYTVFDEESESEVENLEILHPDLEIQENQKKTLKNLYFYDPMCGLIENKNISFCVWFSLISRSG